MSLSIGIVGLPNVGKSSLFQAITKKQVDCANYPFCTIEPNVGVVAVKDERVDKLADLTKSAKKIYNTCEFVDIAGLVKGASKGEGLGNQFLANIREVDAILYVLRIFKNSNVVNTQETVDPLRDKEILDIEMALKDLVTLEKRLEGLEREVRVGKKDAAKELEVLQKAKAILEQEKILADVAWTEDEQKILNSFQLLTIKPRFFLLNGEERDLQNDWQEFFQKNNLLFLVADVLTEMEAEGMSEKERLDLGLSGFSKLDELIKMAFLRLGLITFLTTGPDETRAWSIKHGAKAPQAGGAIHTDFEKYFIRAEVINWQTLLDSGGFTQARSRGLIRTEGKDYIVQDGDVIEIKHGK